jgi:hypothetical protein
VVAGALERARDPLPEWKPRVAAAATQPRAAAAEAIAVVAVEADAAGNDFLPELQCANRIVTLKLTFMIALKS